MLRISDLRLGSCWPSCSDFRKSEDQPVKIWVAYKKKCVLKKRTKTKDFRGREGRGYDEKERTFHFKTLISKRNGFSKETSKGRNFIRKFIRKVITIVDHLFFQKHFRSIPNHFKNCTVFGQIVLFLFIKRMYLHHSLKGVTRFLI